MAILKKIEVMPEKPENIQKANWIWLVQFFSQIAVIATTLIIVPWGTWVTVSIFHKDAEIAELKKWQENRPRFVTTEEMRLADMEAERQLREKITAKIESLSEKISSMDKNILETKAMRESIYEKISSLEIQISGLSSEIRKIK